MADARVEADGSLTLLPRPRVLAVLDEFRDVRKGVISNPGPGAGAAERAFSALQEAFPGRFTDNALVHWGSKDNREIFDEAVAATAGEDSPPSAADDCVFVGEDPQERAFAREAGLRTAVHPVFTRAAVENRPVFRARIELSDGQELTALETVANRTEVVPLHVTSARLVPAMASTIGATALEQAGFTVDLRGPVEEAETPLVHDDRFLAPAPAHRATTTGPGTPFTS
ncbi:HAD family hydrolase [Streptomyces sp. NPDC059371]|uniref:HAD family hydrolase n=1 Tax=Streptomyces sp. NPDC059371 TaxID=3346812 RepID=UPI0036AC7DFD